MVFHHVDASAAPTLEAVCGVANLVAEALKLY